MTTPTEAPGASELPLVHRLESTLATVAISSHAGALTALDNTSKYAQLIREHVEMIQAGKTSREIISHL